MGRVTAVFDDRSKAERAVKELRAMGVADAHLSFVSKDQQYGEMAETARETGSNIGKGVGVGAAAGALFGIAAALIPGAGPFIAAGALAQALGAVGGGALAGAVVGGTAGGLAGAFAKAGYSRDEAEYYGGSVERGGIVVAAEVSSAQETEVRSLLSRHGGQAYGADASDMPSSMRDIPASGEPGRVAGGMGGSSGMGGMSGSGTGSTGFHPDDTSTNHSSTGSTGGLGRQIRQHMMVHARGAGSMMGAQGVHIGTVDRLEGDQIKLTRNDSPDGKHHYIPLSWVERVDTQNNAVILRVDADEARQGWR
ncbi:MAG: DUF2171 domain-containing protein [Meiothermus sp.]|nr:DUF2171 domain-containing protein [Meiothermus sp.]